MKTIPYGWMIALGSAKHFHLYVSVSSNQRRIAHCCFPVVCDRIRQNFHFISTSLFVSFIKLRCGDYWKSIPFQGLGFSQAKTRWMFGVAGLWTFILWWFPEPTNFLYLSFFLLCGNEHKHDEKFCRPKVKWVWINWRKWSSVELDLLHCALQFVLSQPIRWLGHFFFSRAYGRFKVLSSYWFPEIFSFPLIGHFDCFGSDFTTISWKVLCNWRLYGIIWRTALMLTVIQSRCRTTGAVDGDTWGHHSERRCRRSSGGCWSSDQETWRLHKDTCSAGREDQCSERQCWSADW